MKITFDNNIHYETKEKETTLFEVSRQMSIPVAFGCRVGKCGVCLIKVSGDIKNISVKTPEEKEWTTSPSQRLACQCIIKGDIYVSRV